MADNAVLRLVVDDKEYNNSLRQARQGLQALEKSLQEAGKSFSDVDGQVLEYTKALGRMQTTSNSTKGKINEMSQAFVELSLQYRKLSDEEKNSPFGKALAKSLEELKTRVNDSKKELQEVQSELGGVGSEGKETGGILETLASKFTINIDALKLFEYGLSAVNGVLSVVKDAFFKNEQNLDEWGRTVKSCESIYSGFLVALNTGDIGGYLSNIDDIVTAARAAYDALDELNTFNAFNQVNRTKSQASFQDAINNYRANPSEINRVMLNSKFSTYRGNLATRQQLEQAAYEAEIVSVATDHGINPQDLKDALSGSWGNYKSLKALKPSKKVTEASGFSGIYGGGAMMFGNSSTTRFVPANDAERLGEALRQLNDTELQYLQSLGAAANSTGIEITNLERQMLRVTRSGNRGGGGGGRGSGGKAGGGGVVANVIGSVADLNQQISELRKAQAQSVNVSEWDEWQVQIDELTDKVRILKGEIAGSFDENGNVAISLAKVKGIGIGQTTGGLSKQNLNVKAVNTEKKEDKTLQRINQMVGSVSSIASSLNQLGIEIPKGMSDMLSGIQAVITILEAIQTIEYVGSILGIFAGGGVVKAAKGYRVPGSSYSGDRVPILANSGEMVLNQFQQQALAANLQANNSGLVDVQPWVDSEHIWLGMSNRLKRKGEGEIVTTGMLRRMGIM